uniref:Serpentine Receptor, class H n=1 Tax=Caenorhabditis tropicalis TaxID=1561998 RepID=A0A1I7T6K6_9PELO
MSRVKFSMLLMHFTCVWIDIYFNLLAIPYVMHAAASGYTLGLLALFRVPTPIIYYFAVVSLFLLGPAIILFFEDRYHRLARLDSETKSRHMKRLIYFGFNYFVSFISILPSFFNIPNAAEAKVHLLQEFPCIPSVIVEKSGFFTLAYDNTIIVSCLLGYMTFATTQALFFIYRTTIYLSRIKTVSKQTIRLQRQYFKNLVIQTTVPILIVATPTTYLNVSAALDYLDMGMNNVAILWLTTHGIFSTVTMLMVHKPYRDASLGFLVEAC